MTHHPIDLPQPSGSRARARRAGVAVAAAAAVTAALLSATPAFAADVTNTIAEVQGSAASSPMAGNGIPVTVEGVVTSDYRTGGYNGVYIQTQGSGGATDATPGQSDGIFVFLGTGTKPALAIGDLVRATGLVSEFGGQTQITSSAAGSFEVVQSAVGLPAPTPLADTVLGADREQYEGMLVTPTGTYALTSSHQLFNFGSLWLTAGAGLPVKATEQVQPGADATAITTANLNRRILLDDGYSIQVTNAAHVGEQPYFTTGTVVRNGDTLVPSADPYVLGYGFNDWRLQPQVPITDASPAEYKPSFTAVNPRPAAPPAVGGDIRIGSFNVFNYFTTFPSQNPDARGADDAADFAIQKSKIIAAINGLDADVVALEEIENSLKLGEAKDEALADLVAGLNAAPGGGDWAYVPTPDTLVAGVTDFITTAIIYRDGVLDPVGASQTVPIDETVWGNAREPIAQTFTAGTRTFTVVANHLKSKTPPTGSPSDPGDGQGWFNADRVAQAKQVLAFANSLQASSGSGDVFLIGDFNAYGEEDPIDVFTDAGWSDLVPERTDQYTYTFDGELGSLDHVLASPSVASAVTGVGVWNINSPEWSDRGFEFGATEAGTPYRSSDHDPIVVGLSEAVVPVDISLVTMNDFHGRIENEGSGSATAGIAAISSAVKQIRAANPNTIWAAAGDLIGASTFTSFIQQDNPTIDALNLAGLDVSSVGNHEFDKGWADLRDRVLPRALWEYLGANVYDRATGKPALPEYYTETLQGVTVGFIGAVTNELPSLVSPAGIADLEIRDVATEVNRVADDLRDGDPANGEADVVILLVHEGAATTSQASAEDPATPFGHIVTTVDDDVDAIVSGHTHLAYSHVIDGRPVTSAGQYGQKFGLMDIKVDPSTKALISMDNQIIDAKNSTTSPTGTVTYSDKYPADPALVPLVADATAKASVLGAVKVGDITGDFNRAFQPAPTPTNPNATADNRGAESTLGNFVADVQLWAAQQDAPETQIAFMNPGGLRADMKYASTGAADPDGNLTYKEAANVQPFANTLVRETLTGAQVKQALEEQWQPAAASRPMLHLGVSKDLTYTYDPSAAAGSHITHVYYKGVEIDPAATFTVVVNSFLAAGGDNFATLGQGANKADTGKVDLESMVEYFKAQSTASPDWAQRAVGVVLTAPAGGSEYEAGESVTATLSSLAYTGPGDAASGDVSLSLGGAVVGTAPVDPAVVPTTDEAGRATVTFTVPEGLEGVQQLLITTPAGTSIAVPITIAAVEVPVAVDSVTIGYANTVIASRNSTIKYTVVVAARGGVEATGDVGIYDGSKLLATVTLDAGDRGRATVTLPKLKAGLHLLSARYAGSPAVNPSRSLPFPVLVF